jgi:predicted component of type VI protein secretion system
MLLALSIVSEQGVELGSAAYKVFDERGGSIGRVAGNDWVLPDAQNFVSSRHARVSAANGMFYLEDMSSNGTFINAPDQATSRERPQPLNDGDRLYIGDYEIVVQVIGDEPVVVPQAAYVPVPAPGSAPTLVLGAAPASSSAAGFASGAAPASSSAAGFASGAAPASSSAAGFASGAALASSSAAGFASGAAPASSSAAGFASGASAFVSSAASPSALGLGTVDPLAALADTASVPIAASAAAKPLDDVAFHQAAVHAAVRAGFNAMLAKLHPQKLEEIYERKLKRTAVLGIGNKAKYWDLLCAQFEEIDRDREAHFQILFGEEFSVAYNEHLQKLVADARLRRTR